MSYYSVFNQLEKVLWYLLVKILAQNITEHPMLTSVPHKNTCTDIHFRTCTHNALYPSTTPSFCWFDYDKLFSVFDNFTVTVKTSEKRKVKHCRPLTWRDVFLNNMLMAFPSHLTAKPAALCPLDIRECPGISCHGNGCYGLKVSAVKLPKNKTKTKAINSCNVLFCVILPVQISKQLWNEDTFTSDIKSCFLSSCLKQWKQILYLPVVSEKESCFPFKLSFS